jgi:ribose-phosphate pyrophosphokinase
MEKKRLNPRRVAVRFSGKQKLSGKSAIIVDDAISTGGTIIAAARELKNLGTKRVLALVAHFTRGAWESDAVNKLKKEGILLKCTNSIKSKASEAGVAGLIAKALKNC